ncbi:MAG TPA: hypothetical protein VKB88_21810 [Bryobacteraceae bacterium]|nr:hypothetical protein [Bryobacteraceae bacterium]
MTGLIGLLLVSVIGGYAVAQEGRTAALITEQQRNRDWAVALGARFDQLHDPVVATYALGRLAETVCANDPVAGAELFRNSLGRLRLLSSTAFNSARHRLPVPSFSTLWKTLTPAAAKCSADLRQLDDREHAKAKMLEERQQANGNLGRALSLASSDPDRAAQLARTAISASDPMLLDVPTLTLFLSNLRDRAADLADELFPEALNFIASARQPNPELLLELGEYLFTSYTYREVPDVQQASEIYSVGTASIANFSANRNSSSSEDIRQYIDAALKVLTATNDPYYDPVAAYAIGYQLLPKVDDFAPDSADDLRKAVAAVRLLAGAQAGQVESAFAPSSAADPEGGEAPRRRDLMVGRVLTSVVAGRFAEARDMLTSVDDLPVSSQVGSLIDFAESAVALGRKDVPWSLTLANGLRGGVKRALLYAGLAAATQDHGEALGYSSLAVGDTELLPAEQRMITAAGLAGAILRADAANGFNALNLFVEAANDAYSNPREGRFDPQVLRNHSVLSKSTAYTDSSLILANSRCLCEVVDTGRGRHNFPLKVPGLQTTDLAGVVRIAYGISAERLETLLLALRDETLMAAGLNTLASVRLGR